MAWNGDYSVLAAALVGMEALSDTDAAATLNAQTVSISVDIQTADVRAVLFSSGEWGPMKLGSRASPTGTAADATTAALITCIDTLELAKILQTSDPAHLAAVQGQLAMLRGAGLISQATHDALAAMPVRVLPKWTPIISDQDVHAARNPQPLESQFPMGVPAHLLASP